MKALADRHRLRIVNMLLRADGEAVCVCEFAALPRPLAGHRQPSPEEAGRGRPGRARGARHPQLLQPRPRRPRLGARGLRARPPPAAETWRRPDLAAPRRRRGDRRLRPGLRRLRRDRHRGRASGQRSAPSASRSSSAWSIMAMVYATGHLSGAHLNPAVTLAFALTRHFPRAEALAYIAAQLLGALVGGAAAGRDLAEPAGRARHDAAQRRRRQRPRLRGGADRLPDVRDHGRGDRHPRGRRRRRRSRSAARSASTPSSAGRSPAPR